ncbi:hypothetical protein [Sporosarcina sp. P37]|uniref:hypothetical protein n=1 Tax=Sporosarcina sp. P37 TaxID=1930546 RepID=UPI0012F4AB7C|nr:hypothetical protein [Sporosarcina sp. P37]
MTFANFNPRQLVEQRSQNKDRTALDPLRRWRMASAMSQTGSAPGCLIATPTACKAPPFS